MPSLQEESREKILHLFVENPHQPRKMIAKSVNVNVRTVNRVISRYLETGNVKRKVGSGNNLKPDSNLMKKVDRALTTNPLLSLADLARKFATTKSKIRTAKAKLNYDSRKVQKAPHRSDKQNATAKSRAMKLYKDNLSQSDACIIMDDESYLKADPKQMPGQQFYCKRRGRNVNDKFRYKFVDKFAKKFMFWQAICSCGLKTQSYVCVGTMKSPEYIRECLEKRLLPLYRKHTNPPLFWPDLATIHYSKDAISWYKANGVRYVDKAHNPPNCPELRPIERYWANLKRILIKTSSASAELASFKRKYTAASLKIDGPAVQRLMEGVKRKVRQFGRGEKIK